MTQVTVYNSNLHSHSNCSKSSRESRFPILSKHMKSILSLPHSNADDERIFSTKQRNKLKTSTLDALLLTKQSMRSSCVDL